MSRAAARGGGEVRAAWSGRRDGGAVLPPRGRRARLILIALFVILGLAALIARCAHLQIFQAGDLLGLARAQHERSITLDPHRGPILDRNGSELALTLAVDSVFADPALVGDPEATARRLSQVLKVGRATLRARLRSDRNFVWIKRKIDPEDRRRLENLGLPGIGFVRESRRYYPKHDLAAHVVGATGVDNQGLAGLEFAYDDAIRGTPGRILFDQDGRGGHIVDRSRTEAVPGDGLVLTLDATVQYVAERELEAALAASRARGAAVVVLRPATGEILALASRPTFDPNAYAAARQESRRNRAVSDFYEPGSTFKAVTTAIALESGRVRPNDVIWCENGSIVIARHRFDEDRKPFGNLTVGEVLARSSNVGAIKLGLRVEPEAFLASIRRFGFGARSGIELPAESPGLLRDLPKWSGLSQASISMGQEIGATPLQLAAAFAAIANDGVLNAPYIVREVLAPDGRPRGPGAERRAGLRVVSAATAQALRRMLISVTTDGTGERAAVSGFSVGGKTGTAQKVDESGRYARGRYVAWFAGFVPADRPELAIAVMVDEPQGQRFHGGDVAAPVFAGIARPALQHLGVLPDRDGTLVFERSSRASRARFDRSGQDGDSASAGRVFLRGAQAAAAGRPGAVAASLVHAPPKGAAGPGDGRTRERGRGTVTSMPDLIGMGLRDASETIAAAGLRCRLKGSGRRVTDQSPPPGTGMSQESGCTVVY
jgi:cell division protein FtsI (penicillin-binding protein 3)